MNKIKYTYTIEQLKDAVKSSSSIAQVLQKLGLNASGGAYKSIHNHIKVHDLDIKHFTGQAHNKGKKYFKPVIPLNEILEGLHPHYQTFKLKERLFRDAIFDRKCSCCGLTTWMNKQIPLELDHINGMADDHRLVNLRVLCANCHAQTETYCAKNKQTCRSKVNR